VAVLSARSYWLTFLVAVAACGALYAGLVVIQLGAPTGLTEYTERYAVAQERLATQRGRKLFYASGSSGFYGVRCEELSQGIGRPAINFGLHGGLGLRYLMDRVLAAATTGDVIVIGPEWENYRGPRFGEYACDYIMSRRPGYLKSLPITTAIQLLAAAGPERIGSGLLSRFLKGTLPDVNTEPLASVNVSGDRVITPADIKQQSVFAKKLSAEVPQWQPPPRELTHDVDAFVKACREKGVRVVAVFPPLCVKEKSDHANVSAASDGMRRFWADRGIQVLGTAEDALYGPNDAFDTPYHLVEPAALIHTGKLARLLKAADVLCD
jgi:hypothetical protein